MHNQKPLETVTTFSGHTLEELFENTEHTDLFNLQLPNKKLAATIWKGNNARKKRPGDLEVKIQYAIFLSCLRAQLQGNIFQNFLDETFVMLSLDNYETFQENTRNHFHHMFKTWFTGIWVEKKSCTQINRVNFLI